jgi:hypothetical protein
VVAPRRDELRDRMLELRQAGAFLAHAHFHTA